MKNDPLLSPQAYFVATLQSDFEKGFAERQAAWLLKHHLYEEALALAHDHNPKIAFRSSYALEAAFLVDPEALTPYHATLLRNFLTVTNPSAQRHYTKIIALLLKNRRFSLSPQERERVVERSFDLLISPQGKVAVKTWAMEILEQLSTQGNGWEEEELYETLKNMVQEGSPGIRVRGREVIRRIQERKAATKNMK